MSCARVVFLIGSSLSLSIDVFDLQHNCLHHLRCFRSTVSRRHMFRFLSWLSSWRSLPLLQRKLLHVRAALESDFTFVGRCSSASVCTSKALAAPALSTSFLLCRLHERICAVEWRVCPNVSCEHLELEWHLRAPARLSHDVGIELHKLLWCVSRCAPACLTSIIGVFALYNGRCVSACPTG